MCAFIVMLGPPGAGKGTQAELLAKELGVPHISSGDLFREHMRATTELGKVAQSYIERGDLVPDDVTIAMVRDRLGQPDCARGAILDGFPRTAAQAQELERLLEQLGVGGVGSVPYVSVPVPVLVERLSGRLTCRAEGHVYHRTLNPPRVPGRCDLDGSELYQREDDRKETVRRRIEVYGRQTLPLLDYYRERGMLKEVDGSRPIEEVTRDLLAAVRAR